MSCRLLRKHLDVYVDGELDPATQIEFERHIAVCAGCQELLTFQRAFKAELRQRLAPGPAPESLRARIHVALEHAPPPETVMRPERAPIFRWVPVRPSWGVSAAAAAVMVIAFGGLFGRGSEGESGASVASALPFFEDVVRRHTAANPSEVATASPDQVAPWFRGKVEFPVRPVQFRQPDARLIGWRLSYVNGREAATLYYMVQGHRVTVVALEQATQVRGVSLPVRSAYGSQPVYYQRVHGYTVAVIERDGIAYMATGDLDQQGMLRLAANAHVE